MKNIAEMRFLLSDKQDQEEIFQELILTLVDKATTEVFEELHEERDLDCIVKQESKISSYKGLRERAFIEALIDIDDNLAQNIRRKIGLIDSGGR